MSSPGASTKNNKRLFVSFIERVNTIEKKNTKTIT